VSRSTPPAAGTDYATVEETLAGLPGQFERQQAAGAPARFQFDIGGRHRFAIAVADGGFELLRGDIESPGVTITCDESTWVALCNRELGGITAAITGRLKVKGSVVAADRLIRMFGLKF
jgi:putative sterol carrier protein